MKRVSLLLFVVLFAFLFSANSAECAGYKSAVYTVLEDSTGTVGFPIADSLDYDTSSSYINMNMFQYDAVTLEHWADGVSAKDSTYFTIYVYQCLTSPSDDLDSSWVLVDSILNTDGTSFGVHHLDKLTGLVPGGYLKFCVWGIDGKTHHDGINMWIRLYFQYLP